MGIFFLLGDQVLIESTSISDGEFCAGLVNHARGHEKFWEQLQADGLAPRDADYITVPRGRVIFSVQTGKYSLLLDRCILEQPKFVKEIRQRMNLPTHGLQASVDDHYRCGFCMSRSSF